MLSFIAATILLVITPGPGVMSVAGIGAAYGFAAGGRYVLGLWVGHMLVVTMVVSGLAALVLASPTMRTVLFVLSTAYLLYLAARIALAGARIRFIEAQGRPGIAEGIFLQVLNPKAYVVTTTLWSGFAFLPGAYWTEAALKVLIFSVIWAPLHFLWLWGGVMLERLDLPERTQRAINIGMALAMLGVVALAAISALQGSGG